MRQGKRVVMSTDKLITTLKELYAQLTPEKLNEVVQELEKQIERESIYLAELTDLHEWLEQLSKKFDSRQDGAQPAIE